MSNSAQHLNGNIVCAIDTETTGLDPRFHEIIQIAIIPLDSNFNPRQDVLPFYIDLKADRPERAEPEAIKVTRIAFAKHQQSAFDRFAAIDMFEEWFDKKLNPSYRKYGDKRCQIVPLGQNYCFDKEFIISWLGNKTYSEYFDYHYRDTMNVAQFFNDLAAHHAEKIPYPKVNLVYLANKLGVELDRAHNALEDARATAEVYKAFVKKGLII